MNLITMSPYSSQLNTDERITVVIKTDFYMKWLEINR